MSNPQHSHDAFDLLRQDLQDNSRSLRENTVATNDLKLELTKFKGEVNTKFATLDGRVGALEEDSSSRKSIRTNILSMLFGGTLTGLFTWLAGHGIHIPGAHTPIHKP
jgi:hypothetical protein